ncbi:hypothetical protein N177_1241 [Lutibaculum baratangense AMV1]|uniref:Uncharacterized protein n=1 Tax=Lutibaculum baratangense AMV1 TaxID=631454 RepID=V4RIJ4_9HYPH|nr:hypothetical protein N177_1241 [Lutibaculum baratangense AMV1]
MDLLETCPLGAGNHKGAIGWLFPLPARDSGNSTIVEAPG